MLYLAMRLPRSGGCPWSAGGGRAAGTDRGRWPWRRRPSGSEPGQGPQLGYGQRFGHRPGTRRVLYDLTSARYLTVARAVAIQSPAAGSSSPRRIFVVVPATQPGGLPGRGHRGTAVSPGRSRPGSLCSRPSSSVGTGQASSPAGACQSRCKDPGEPELARPLLSADAAHRGTVLAACGFRWRAAVVAVTGLALWRPPPARRGRPRRRAWASAYVRRDGMR